MADKAQVIPPENQEQPSPHRCADCGLEGPMSPHGQRMHPERTCIEVLQKRCSHLDGEIQRLADYIMQQVDGEPSGRDEGVVDCAIRLLKLHIPLPPAPVMRQVSSSNIAAVGYDEQRQRLVVRFQNGSRYAYFNVPPDVHQNLVEATSVGSFLNRNIRDRYTYRKLGD